MRILALFFLAFSFFHTIEAQTNLFSAALIPDSLTEDAYDVIRSEQKLFKVHTASSATYRVKKIITILNKKSKARYLTISYSPDRKVGNIKARVYDASGELVKTISKKEIMDYSAVSNFSIYEDDRIKRIEFFHNSYPFTIEYEYELHYRGVAFYPRWQIQAYRSAVQNARFEVELPASLNINYQAFNIDLEPEISNTERKRYKWSVSNLKAIESEEYSPGYTQILPWVAVVPHYFETAGYKGSMKDWQSYGEFMYRLNKGRDRLSPEMAAKVKALTANAKSDAEKIAILYQYLQENTRYVSVQLGIGGWQTFDAEYVENNKYGDCKALTNFMKSMLQETGITAYPTLISSGRKPFPIPEDLTLPYFNHVILHIPSEEMWLECTSNHYPPNYIGSSNADRNVLSITENGGKLIRTPKATSGDNFTSRHADIKINADGSAHITAQTQYKGAFHEYYRYFAFNYSVEDQKKDFYEDHSLPSFHIDQWNLRADSSQASAQLDCQLKVNKYASRAGKRFFIPLNQLNPFREIPKAIKHRKYPIHLNLAYSEEDHFTFSLPPGYELESYPKDPIQISSPYGTYEVKVEWDGEQLLYHRQLKIESGQFPAEEYDEIRHFYKAIAKKDGLKLVLVKKVIRP